MIHIDTEGWEDKVILGAQKLIKRTRPILFIEFHFNFSRSFKNVSNVLCTLGYVSQVFFCLNALFNKVVSYYVFYPHQSEKLIGEIYNNLLKCDFSSYYYEVCKQNDK